MSQKDLPYKEAKKQAADADPKVRGDVAGRSDVSPEVLVYLAEDADPAVRRRVAANPATPSLADERLADDPDQEVRRRLAGKIARLAPTLSVADLSKAQRHTLATLQRLSRDQHIRVRIILADILKGLPEVPADVVGRLARDPALAVAAPILEFSSQLSNTDLINIIRTTKTDGVLSAIARRVELHGEVADTIAEGDDDDAIAALLANRTAQIREDTLDLLVARAPAKKSWHAPLVHRPGLSSGLAVRLAHFVTHRYIEALRARLDLNDGTLAAIELEVQQRIARGDLSAAPPQEDLDVPMEQARGLHQRGQLTESHLKRSLSYGDTDLVIAAVAVLGNIPRLAVKK